MSRKKSNSNKKIFMLLLIGIFVLSGCGQRDNSSMGAADNHDGGEIGAHIEQPEDRAEDSESNEASEEPPKPSEVPVNVNAEDISYHSEDDINILYAVHRCKSDGENIYLAYGRPDLYVMPVGADQHTPANIDNPEGLNVCNIAIDRDGRIHLLMVGQNNEEWYIWRLDRDYQVDKKMDVTPYFKPKQVPIWFLIDKDGTYYFQWPIDRNGVIIDSEGALKHELTPESLGIRWIYEAAVGKDGRIYLVYGNVDDEKLEIGELDAESCSVKKGNPELYFPAREPFSLMAGGTDTNLLLFCPFSGVWAYDDEKGILENRVPPSELGSGIDGEFQPLAFLPDGRLLLPEKNGNDNNPDDARMILKYIPVGK